MEHGVGNRCWYLALINRHKPGPVHYWIWARRVEQLSNLQQLSPFASSKVDYILVNGRQGKIFAKISTRIKGGDRKGALFHQLFWGLETCILTNLKNSHFVAIFKYKSENVIYVMDLQFIPKNHITASRLVIF